MIKNRHVVKGLWSYFKNDKILIFISFFSAIICASLTISASILVGFSLTSLDQFFTLKDSKALNCSLILASIAVACFVLFWLFNTFIYRIMIVLSHRAGSKIREKIFIKILSLSIAYMDSKKTGEFISRTTNDIDQMISNLTQSLASSFVSPFIIFGMVVIMLLISPYLSIIYFLMLPLIFGGSGFIAKSASPSFSSQQEKLGQLNATSLELIENKDATYFFRNQKYVLNKYETISGSYMNDVRKGEYKIRLVWPWIDVLENATYGIIFILGFVLQKANTGSGSVIPVFKEMNIGITTMILSFTRLINGELGNVARLSSMVQRTIVCASRALSLIGEKSEIDNGQINSDNVIGNVEFKNVSFGYQKNNLIIKKFNLKIKSGTRVAIVGPTGCGKTTLVQLLIRFYELNSGSILIDGINIKEFSKKALSEIITMVLQDTHLFSISIADNIKYGSQDKISLKTVKEAADVMDASHFINVFPDGFNTILKNSSSLSVGQSQLISLARAYISKSKILILDEATSSIDTKTEVEVQKGMLHLMNGKTTFIIAHRLSTIVNSDVIIVMKDGNIVEMGHHNELLENKNFYYDLYNAKISE